MLYWWNRTLLLFSDITDSETSKSSSSSLLKSSSSIPTIFFSLIIFLFTIRKILSIIPLALIRSCWSIFINSSCWFVLSSVHSTAIAKYQVLLQYIVKFYLEVEVVFVGNIFEEKIDASCRESSILDNLSSRSSAIQTNELWRPSEWNW